MDLDPEPKSMAKCLKHSNWDKWKAAIKAELRSLYEREVLGHVVPTSSEDVPEGYKWVVCLKRNKHGTKRG